MKTLTPVIEGLVSAGLGGKEIREKRLAPMATGVIVKKTIAKPKFFQKENEFSTTCQNAITGVAMSS